MLSACGRTKSHRGLFSFVHEDGAPWPDIGRLEFPSINPFVRNFNKDKKPNEPDWDDAKYNSVLAVFREEEIPNKEMTEDEEFEVNFAEDTHMRQRAYARPPCRRTITKANRDRHVTSRTGDT
ncbi:hypothetical protein LTR37_005556 [Vermiconidia calcicola]|uniref:Uncharacterized protein n=1 Tax=Vermiconidia calcicola TaxID=1690605 RepID=A0ACC3NIQ3_9PEZI|nr:hypothetical protein LTR37_005556 [Vermiconidia calcicola]